MRLYLTQDSVILNLDKLTYINEIAGVYRVFFSENNKVVILKQDYDNIVKLIEKPLQEKTTTEKPLPKIINKVKKVAKAKKSR